MVNGRFSPIDAIASHLRLTPSWLVATETEQQSDASLADARSPEESLRRKVMRGIGWEMAGQFGMQAWRFVSNLVLTRLLVPEAFGLIGIVQVVMLSLTLLSDVGLQSSVIHDRRGNEPRFLNTVWTVSVVRGFLMWLATCLLALPIASFFDMPGLLVLLPITAISAVVRGFASTSLMTASRNLKNYWYVQVECGSQIIGTTISVCLALWLRSAVALAWGWVATAAAFTFLSYCRRDVQWNRLCWDREIAGSLSQFGRWALASGVLTIWQQRGDRLALGKIISTTELGTYVIGSNLALLPMTVYQRLNNSVGQPVYARVRHLPASAARSKIRRLRWGIVAAHSFALSLLVVIAQPLVDLIYSAEYHRAGWYCALAALACLVRVGSDMGPVFLAHGDSWSHFKVMAVRTMALVFAMVVGYVVGKQWGVAGDGLLYGVIAAPMLAYPYQAIMYRRINVWLPEIDMLALVPAGLLVIGQAMGVI
jgi:O-antigen/teichoic acid export membrane protein